MNERINVPVIRGLHSASLPFRWYQTGRIEPVIPRTMALAVLEEDDAKLVDEKLHAAESDAEAENQVRF